MLINVKMPTILFALWNLNISMHSYSTMYDIKESNKNDADGLFKCTG